MLLLELIGLTLLCVIWKYDTQSNKSFTAVDVFIRVIMAGLIIMGGFIVLIDFLNLIIEKI